LSFVRSGSDLLSLKELLAEQQKSDIRVIAKIEKPEAVKNLKEIIDVSDGVMVARGDLGVEMPAEKVPLLQKMIIERSNKAEKLVITATQMLESMVNSPRPTRAEASDVANAILDGTDVVMLSQETAIGAFPVKAVRTMAAIAQYTESDGEVFQYVERIRPQRLTNFTHAIVHSARAAAEVMKADAILVFTQSGFTAHLASCQRPPCPIYAFTPVEKTYRQLALVWGVSPFLMEPLASTEAMIKRAEEILLTRKALQRGDVVVILSGTQPVRGATNMMKMERME
ncbi:MAG TPA: pyruvate kinase, partial [Acidobacteriota bacterium]|nr:pyruvate kinase [Acidobacteriota bacterium]